MLLEVLTMREEIQRKMPVALNYVVYGGFDSLTFNEATTVANQLRGLLMRCVPYIHLPAIIAQLKVFFPIVLCSVIASYNEGNVLPKLMRVTAGDKAGWMGTIHPAVYVANALPSAYSVLHGKICTAEMITEACVKHGVNPNSWLSKEEPFFSKPAASKSYYQGVPI